MAVLTKIHAREQENTHGEPAQSLQARRDELLARTQSFADELAHRHDDGSTAAPVADLERMTELGLMTAFIPVSAGGLALCEPGAQYTLLRLLASVGGADLVLGRLFEGHLNALLLLNTFGNDHQREQAARDARNGRLFGVWNTGAPEPLCLKAADAGYELVGVKTFATGAAIVHRPVVTAAMPDSGGWQMTLPRMNAPDVASRFRINRDFWSPLGMEASESFEVDFTGVPLQQDDLFGAPGDFYRDPLFRGGAIRFAAVHAGATLRLHTSYAEWLHERGRGEDPYQLARLGRTALLAREAALWVERASFEAEAGLMSSASPHATERVVDFANAMRVAVERLASEMIAHVTAGVGAHGLLRPHRFGRMLRDLTMYLRQPAPDQTLAEVGRSALRRVSSDTSNLARGIWRE